MDWTRPIRRPLIRTLWFNCSFESAEKLFSATLDMVTAVAAQNREPIPATWEPLLNNLAHCMRKNKRYREALDLHKRALVLKPQTASTFTAIGFVQTLMGQLENAIDSFHKSLALCHDEIFTLTILQYVTDDLKEELDVYTPSFRKWLIGFFLWGQLRQILLLFVFVHSGGGRVAGDSLGRWRPWSSGGHNVR